MKKKVSKNKGRVFVGMSGGVDSSVSAALLQKAGYDVTGVFIKVWSFDLAQDKSFGSEDFAQDKPFDAAQDKLKCAQTDDRLDAMRVAAHLGIPFKTLDLEKEYKRNVVDYMIREYKAGRTPNPDVMCNRHIKFGAFLKWALKQGADYVATGHYASTQNRMLKAGLDTNKDQSYFLWTLTEADLKHVLFPVGHLHKPAVRLLAKKFGLMTADKKDSQGLCFIGKVDMKEFLKEFIPGKRGAVLNRKGEVVGAHSGSLFYTLGERHGFTITKKTPSDRPYFVVAKDSTKNTLTVSHKNTRGELPLSKRKVALIDVNWLEIPKTSKKYSARIRYRQPLSSCTIKKNKKGEWSVHFSQAQAAVSSGQSLVVYDKAICLGGGIIA